MILTSTEYANAIMIVTNLTELDRLISNLFSGNYDNAYIREVMERITFQNLLAQSSVKLHLRKAVECLPINQFRSNS